MDEFTPSIKKQVLDFLGRPDYEPLKQHDLAVALGCPRPLLRRTLRDLEEEGAVVCLRKNRWGPARAASQATGALRVHSDGFGFVTPEEPGRPDVYVPPEGLGSGMDGDRVVVSVQPTPRGPAGRVLRVLARGFDRVVGSLRRGPFYWYVIPDAAGLRENVRVADEDNPAGARPDDGHKVVVELEERRTGQGLRGRIVEDLGPADAPGVDVLSIMRRRGMDSSHSPAAIRAAERADTSPAPASLEGRADWRDRVVFTIDPEDARDYDDAVSLTVDGDGNWQLGVHIADVAHFVSADSPIDEEARHRGASVYLVDRVVPMLPPRLTTEVCSLKPDMDRLTHSVCARLDPFGRLLEAWTGPSVIRSRARLTYAQVQDFLDGGSDHGLPTAVGESLTLMRRLAELLRRRRMEAGSLDLSLPEIRCILDERGRPRELRKRVSSEAYQLIEEFMLVANRAVAQKISRAGFPCLYRVHDAPDEAQWEQMRAELRALGFASPSPDAGALNAIARRAMETPMAYSAHLAILRNLKRAQYAPAPGLHFGLAFGCYLHFTSPIRRYPDLVAHRVLRAVETRGAPPCAAGDIVHLAAHCSRREAAAAEAEEESLALKRLEYYKALIARGATGPFQGVVVGLHPRGLQVELTDTLQRGFLSFSDLPGDCYSLDEARVRAVGRRRRTTWTVGQTLQVGLTRVDERRGRVGLSLWVETGPGARRRRKGPRA